jgi:outer membrane protein TolC
MERRTKLKRVSFVFVTLALALLWGSCSLAETRDESRWEKLLLSFQRIPHYRLAQAKESEATGNPSKEGTTNGQSGPLTLSLQDCIEMSLRNNLDIAVEGYNPKMREEDITREKAAFDPSFDAAASYWDYRVPTNRKTFVTEGLAVTEVDLPDKRQSRDLNFGWKQNLVTGTSYEIQFNNDRWNSLLAREIVESTYQFNPAYTSVLSLTLNQALLRNFGIDINKTRIYIAQNNTSISVQQFRNQVFTVLTEAQVAYWALAASIENLEVNRRSLKLAQDLLEINKAKVKAGTLAPLDIVQAEAEVASREEGVITAENLIRNVEDRLRRVMNLPQDSQMWERPIKPSDRPTFEPQPVSVDESMKRALELRPDYAEAKIDLDSKGIFKRYAKNQLFPSLNLQGSAGLNSIGEDYHDNYRSLRTGDWYNYGVGLVLEVPIGNRAARAQYTQASLDQEKSKISLTNVEQKILVEVREAIRQIETNMKRIESTRKARILSEKKLEVEQKKLTVGMSTNFEVLRVQRDLVEAETNLLRAVLDYKTSLINLERVEGTILERHNIELKES